MRMYLISDNIDTYTGMRLSGVEGVVVHEREELEEALSFVTGQPDIGIVLLTEKLGRDFPELVNDLKLIRRTPLFVEIPDRHGSGRSKNFITDYVSQAIGLKL
mgnify:FL=1